MKKRILLALLALMMMLTLFASCAQETPTNIEDVETSQPQEQADDVVAEDAAQEMIFVLSNLPDGLDPGITSNSFAKYVLFNCFEGLVTYDETGSLVGGMAQDWDISEDGLVYTFNLRDGLMWSDGTPLTANDFVYSILRVATPETTSQYSSMVTSYILNAQEFYDGTAAAEDVGVKAIDDTTLEITLMQPASFFIDILSMWVYMPVQQATVEANGDAWTTAPESYISNGPFKVTGMSMSENVIIEKNENYWNAENVAMEKIEFRYILDTSTALTAYESGEVDGIVSIPPTDYARLRAEDAGVQTFPSYATTYYLINTTKEPYNDPLVRKALNLAIDRQSIIDNVIQVAAEPAYSFLSPGYSIDGTDITEGRGTFELSNTADVEAARAALAEAGYPDGEGFPTLELSYYSDNTVKLIVEAMAVMLEENLNIEVEIVSSEWQTYYEEIQAENFDVGAMGWSADFLHPMSFIDLLITGGSYNDTGYSNPEYDALAEQARVESDPLAAAEIVLQADDIASNDYVVLPLYYRSSSILIKDHVDGYHMNATAALFFKDTTILPH